MRQLQYQKLLSKTQIMIGILLSIGVFILMSIILKPFTFSPDPTIAQIQACFAAVPVATTFWFACNMFMLVLSDQIKRKKEKSRVISNPAQPVFFYSPSSFRSSLIALARLKRCIFALCLTSTGNCFLKKKSLIEAVIGSPKAQSFKILLNDSI